MLDHSLARPAWCRARARNGSVLMAGPFLYVTEFDDPIALETALRSYFLERRPVSVDASGHRYPETAVFEIAQIAATLYAESRRYGDRRRVSLTDSILFGPLAHLANELGRDDDYAGHRAAVERFADYYKRLRTELNGLPPGARYPGNATAWREFRNLVARLAVAKDHAPAAPSVVRSVVRSVEKLPATLAHAAESVGRAALRPLDEIGDRVKAIAIPVAIGGGALLGLVLLASKRERAS